MASKRRAGEIESDVPDLPADVYRTIAQDLDATSLTNLGRVSRTTRRATAGVRRQRDLAPTVTAPNAFAEAVLRTRPYLPPTSLPLLARASPRASQALRSRPAQIADVERCCRVPPSPRELLDYIRDVLIEPRARHVVALYERYEGRDITDVLDEDPDADLDTGIDIDSSKTSQCVWFAGDPSYFGRTSNASVSTHVLAENYDVTCYVSVSAVIQDRDAAHNNRRYLRDEKLFESNTTTFFHGGDKDAFVRKIMASLVALYKRAERELTSTLSRALRLSLVSPVNGVPRIDYDAHWTPTTYCDGFIYRYVIARRAQSSPLCTTMSSADVDKCASAAAKRGAKWYAEFIDHVITGNPAFGDTVLTRIVKSI